MSEGIKPSTGFWVISIIALLWNLLGLMAFAGMMVATPEMISEQYGDAYGKIFAAKPAWATGAFAIAVITGTLGCIGLLLRKSWSKILFIVSLIGIIIHNIWGVMAGTLAHVGTFDKIMTVVVMAIAVFLIWFANKKTAAGVLT